MDGAAGKAKNRGAGRLTGREERIYEIILEASADASSEHDAV